MKEIHHFLFFCFFSALYVGNTGLVNAKFNIYTGAEGGDGTISCYLTLSGSRKFFCKEECKEQGILVKSDRVRANSGRYSIKYENGSSGRGILSVTIKKMIQSDSGRYRCGLGSSLVPDSYSDFEVRVSNELDRNAGFVRTNVEGETFRQPCFDSANRSRIFLCKDECKKEEDVLIETDQKSGQIGRYSIEYTEGSVFGLYVTITPVTKSDMRQYKCGYGRALSPDSSYTFSVFVIDAPTTSKPTQSLRPFSTSVPLTSTTTLSLSSSSRSSTRPVFPETTNQPTAAALTTSKPNQTFQPFSASVPSSSSATTVTQSLSSTSGSSAFPDTTDQFTVFSCFLHPGYFLLLVVCVPLVAVLLLVVLLLYIWKTMKNSRNIELPVLYKKMDPISTCEATIMYKEQTVTLMQTAHN